MKEQMIFSVSIEGDGKAAFDFLEKNHHFHDAEILKMEIDKESKKLVIILEHEDIDAPGIEHPFYKYRFDFDGLGCAQIEINYLDHVRHEEIQAIEIRLYLQAVYVLIEYINDFHPTVIYCNTFSVSVLS